MIDLEIKEMPIEERYDRLLDDFMMGAAMNYALFKELGVDKELGLEKNAALSVKMDTKTLPGYLGIAVRVLKAITPGRLFDQLINRFLYHAQTWHPLSTIELTKVSDREAVVTVNNCVMLKRMRDVVEKTGLDIDPKINCERDQKYFTKLFPEYGIDGTWELTENGCRCTAKLK